MDYPDPHNEYFDTFYGKKTTGSDRRGSTTPSTRSSRPGATPAIRRNGSAHKKAEEIMQSDVGYVPVAGWRYAAKKPWVGGLDKNKAGEFVVDGNIYVDMLQHLYIIEKGCVRAPRRSLRFSHSRGPSGPRPGVLPRSRR